MPKSFQLISLLLIESIYFAGIMVKGPHTSVWIIPSNSIGPLGSTSKFKSIGPLGSMSKFQNHQTSRKHVQTSNHWTSRKHVQISNPSDLWEARPNFKSTDLWEARLKLQIHQTIGKHVLYSFKKKKHAWTTFRPNPLTKRYVGNLPRDLVHILIQNMTVCIFIYMYHTFTTVKYWLQS